MARVNKIMLPDGTEYILPYEDKPTEMYAPGDIFITTREGNPAVLLGYGTWEQIKDRFILAAGDTYTLGEKGGEAEHKLTKDELPVIKGSFQSRQVSDGWNLLDVYSIADNSFTYTPNGGSQWAQAVGPGGTATTNNARIDLNIGGDQPHNNMPPYLATYIWLRIA